MQNLLARKTFFFSLWCFKRKLKKEEEKRKDIKTKWYLHGKKCKEEEKSFTLSPAFWIFVFILNQISLNLFIMEKNMRSTVMYDYKWNRKCERSRKRGVGERKKFVNRFLINAIKYARSNNDDCLTINVH